MSRGGTGDVDISFIIVNWNTRDMLLDCIRSLDRRSGRFNRETIVVDNGSEDGSVEAVRNAYPRVRIVANLKNEGFSRANNAGIRQSHGRVVCLVNSDILVVGGSPDDMYAYLDRNPSVGAIGPCTLNVDHSLRKNCRTFPSLRSVLCRALLLDRLCPGQPLLSGTLMTYFDHAIVRAVDVLPGCFLMARRSAVDEIGLLDERFFFYGEDKDWCRRFKNRNWEVVFFPGCRVVHFAGASSEKQPLRFAVERLKADFQYWKKYHARGRQLLFLGITILHHATRIIAGVIVKPLRGDDGESWSNRTRCALACMRWTIGRLARGAWLTKAESGCP